MAVPVILGIPWLVEILAGILGGLVVWLCKVVTKKIAVNIILAGSLLVMLALFVGVIHGLLLGLSVVLPQEWGMVMSWIVPANFAPCLSAILSALIAKYTFLFWKRILEFYASMAG